MSDDQGIFKDIAEYIRVSKDSVDLLKGALSLLPRGQKRDDVEKQIQAVEEALKRSDAALALKLGYNLCQCTFPPQIMLWVSPSNSYECPNSMCGRTIKSFNRPLPAGGSAWSA